MLKLTLTFLVISVIGKYVQCDISYKCLRCICQVEGCESQIGKCKMDVGTLSCGPYQIKEPYWIDCGRPGGDWQTCTKQMDCSESCVHAYLHRYGYHCTGGRAPTCQDYARIHNGGPTGCRNPKTLGYWQKVRLCCGGDECADNDDHPSFVVRV